MSKVFFSLLIVIFLPIIAHGQTIPKNAHKVAYGNGWECNRGYYKVNYNSTSCTKVVIPENASLNFRGNDWECNRGYYKKYYNSTGCTKVEVPANASLNFRGNDWECDRGYYKEYYNSTGCTKVEVPANASLNFRGDGWNCNFPYTKRNNSCISVKNATDDEIANLIIQQSLSSYPGNCPSPYNRDRAGRRCGGRSAYSKPGGYSPICYTSQVSSAQILLFRQRYE